MPVNKLITSVLAGLLTLLIVIPAELKTPYPMLILGRFFPNGSYVEIGILTLYASILAWFIYEPNIHKKIRPIIWSLFSIVFFGQLFLGLIGFEQFLMTGKLHPPIPAVIIAGPIFRGGEGLFMVILTGITVALLGSTWCSHLCYFGSIDLWGSKIKKVPEKLPKWRHFARVLILVLVLLVAVLLGFLQVPAIIAGLISIIFGFLGLGINLFISRKFGIMAHCTVYCPLGFVINLLGKLNPFRIKIADSCTKCGACTKVCRYQSLEPIHIERKSPGFTCSLCGDCISVCKQNSLGYHFLGFKSRILFIAIVAAVHSSFLGLARI